VRIAWLLTLVLAWLPPDVRLVRPGGGADGACCGEGCECAGHSASSCCGADEDELVLVAACGCGHPHGPLHLERVAHHLGTAPDAPAVAAAAPGGHPAEPPLPAALRGRRPMPEPPPPRR
jgi:hypothetical protein